MLGQRAGRTAQNSQGTEGSREKAVCYGMSRRTYGTF